jgi:hypothetical protein
VLVGKHTTIECASCHTNNDPKRTPKDCVSCHGKDDSHQATLGSNCAACHTPDGWKPSTFDHTRAAFQLTGMHQQVECRDCHKDMKFKDTPANCAACHAKDDTHQGALGDDCAACHTSDGWKPSTFDHSRAAFPLTGKHLGPACSSCHTDQKYKETPTACAACHAKNDVHKGQLGDCAACHTSNGWKPTTFNHSSAAFQLTGAHGSLACSACHADPTFRGAPTSCAGCHAKNDPHQGSLGSDCKLCHSTNAWKPSTFNHNSTAFKLTGAHANVACSACHANHVFKGTPGACYTCHANDDHHNGQFGQDCVACHATDRWSNVTFDHNRSGFPLTGSHAGLPCQRCHSNGFSNTSSACSSCHTEPADHTGLFLANCAACHNTSAWVPAKYNGPHPFPMNHGGANTCRNCHPSTLAAYTCYTCHDQSEMVSKHREKNVYNLDNCVACHSSGHGD